MSWPIVTLGDVATFIRNGVSLKQSSEASGLKITRIETIADRIVNLDKCGYADLGDSDYPEYRLKRGDILISHINSEKHLGKCAIFELNRDDIVHGMNLLCFRANDKVFPKYVFYYLSSPQFLSQLPTITKKSVNQASFTVTNFKELEIPLPPLTEQKRIAAILDKADAICRKRQQAIELADDFLRAVFLDMFGDPVENPKGWKVKSLSEGIESISSGWSAKGENYPCDKDNYGVLKISAVTSGKFRPEENKFVYAEDIPEGKTLIYPKKGDLLFSRANTRELVAATCIVPVDYNNIFLPDKLWNVKTIDDELLPEFLNYLIWQPRFKETLTSQATGTSGSMLNISKAKFQNTDAIFPPVKIQEKFTSVYWKMQETIQRMEDASIDSRKIFMSLSQKAFSGEL
ncbi:restriction endonuclease subunit S [Vibrio parahaemolyticus]|nr:restriction endonuclease subunit S [Vibrio parahaemolyticus]MDF5072271.1 restriction endonuclease subunit S [Vibrio parahaemolyticus]MDF5300641.1 restriction endonuclease subunit S [Vibrio parahaemolyticus]